MENNYIVEVTWYQNVRDEDKPVGNTILFIGTEDEVIEHCNSLLNAYHEYISRIDAYLYGKRITTIQ